MKILERIFKRQLEAHKLEVTQQLYLSKDSQVDYLVKYTAKMYSAEALRLREAHMQDIQTIFQLRATVDRIVMGLTRTKLISDKGIDNELKLLVNSLTGK